MNIYKDYLNTIETAINADPKNVKLSNGHQMSEHRNFSKGQLTKELNARVPAKRLLPSMEEFASAVGLVPNFDQVLGLHPDFGFLKYSEGTENHYIVSMFVDIKGSTNLFKKYAPETVWVITNTIQRAAIHTCLIFGGYVHRLQGDGLFVYFGGKNIGAELAVERSLQFASVFTYFVQEDLKKIFTEQGIEKIFTRIGVDLGYDRDVIWGMAGIGEISEVTTCSLHTSLASKMQSSAISNGIVIGDNVKSESPKLAEYYTTVVSRTGNDKDRYIFRNDDDEGFYYTQYDFDWLKFLKKQAFIATDLYGNIQLKSKTATPSSINTANLAPIAAISKPFYNF